MPKIPIIEERSVETSINLKAPKLSLTLPRDQTGEIVARFGGRLAEVAQRVEDRRDRIAVEKVYGEMYDEMRELTYGEDGFFNRRGEFVEVGATKILEEMMLKIRNKYSGKLKGRVQQEVFTVKSTSYFKHILDAAAKHESAQHYIADGLVHRADANRAAEIITRQPGAKLSFQLEQMSMGKAALEQELRLEGRIDNQDVKNAKRDYASPIWRAVIESLAERNPKLAYEKFESVKGDMNPDDIQLVTKKLDSETLRVRAQAKTDELWGQHEDDEKVGMDAARKIEDADLRDDTVRRLDARYTEKSQRERAEYVEYVNVEVGSKVDEMNRDPAVTAEEAHNYIDSIRTTLEAPELSRFRAWIDNEKLGKIKVTNQGARIEAMVRVDNKEFPEGAAGATQIQLEYGDRITTADINKIVEYHRKGGNIGGLKNSEAARWFAGYTTKKSTDRPEAYSEFWDYLVDRLEPGKMPTSDDVKNWSVEWLSRPGVVEGIFFDKAKIRAEAIRSKDLEDFRPSYTNEERDAAVDMINAYNAKNPTRKLDPNNSLDVLDVIQTKVRK